jgi:L-seryl-tRNA(Ser) seleniumtransferase
VNPQESDALRRLPAVDRILAALGSEVPHAVAADAARAVIDEARRGVLGGEPAPPMDVLVARARTLLDQDRRRRLARLINATGVLIHTNLGRAPLGAAAIEAMASIGSGYSNLEYDLERGSRGSRYQHARGLLRTLSGAGAALVVNNNAAAVLLALTALASGREVVISRGELIEIGGEFRIPEILASSGARLVEVGTTNRTHRRDYEGAIGPETAAIMKVHPSNYRVVGFVAAVAGAELASVAHERGIPLIHDLGSGLLRRRIGAVEPPWLGPEPTVEEALAEGADVVTFSGDKLLGGPQAGIILGRQEAIEAMSHSPILRAVRVDKTTLAALEATLLAYLEGREAELPLWRMALAPVEEIEERASALASRLQGADAKIELAPGASTTGGGSAPGGEIPTVLVEIAPRRGSADQVVRALIDHDPPVISRIVEDRVAIDLRTVRADEEEALLRALEAALR